MVKTISLKATPSHYLLELDRSSVMDGPTLLQAGGETVAVLIPKPSTMPSRPGKWHSDRL